MHGRELKQMIGDMEKLPLLDNKIEFLKQALQQDKYALLFNDADSIIKILPFVTMNKRLHFLFDILGKEKCAAILGIYLLDILDLLKPSERLTYLVTVIPKENLITKQKNYNEWQQLKAKLCREDRQVLNQYVYTKEDLQAKAILRHIKYVIQGTQWQAEDTLFMTFGKENVKIPKKLLQHITEYELVKTRFKSHRAALKSIKETGRMVGSQYNFFTSVFPSEDPRIQNYFERFTDDEIFNKTFGLKPTL
jgi:hypothetical protein